MTNLAHMLRAAAMPPLRPVLLAAALSLGAGCSTDKILSVNRPDIIDPGALDNSAGATALYAGVIGDLAQAFDGSSVNGFAIVNTVGLITDELRFGATPPEIRQMDQRAAPESNTLVAASYLLIQTTRGQADRAAEALKKLKATDVRIGEMQAISGLMQLVLAEMFCSGVPLSTPGVDGEPLTTTALLQSAVAKLTEAATSAGSDATGKNLAAVLRGRALLDLGQFDAAATAVAGVPTNFAYRSEHSTTTDYQKNYTAVYMNENDGFLVSNREGTNGLDFATANDPRVPITGEGTVSRFDGQTPAWYYARFDTPSSSNVIASGIEARLIEAEAALRAGNASTWLAKLNAARAEADAGLAPLTDPGAPAARVDLTFRERAFSLFLTGHRLGDLRRLIRQYQRTAESVFPTGAYHKDGLQLGTDVQFVIPQTEKNNPKFTGCIDRNA
jgi:hypothetical protein